MEPLLASTALALLPQYRCHKVVRAVRIEALIDHSWDGRLLVRPADATIPPFLLSAAFVAKHRPYAGGYLVVYDEGAYLSFSPAGPFEAGYSRVTDY